MQTCRQILLLYHTGTLLMRCDFERPCNKLSIITGPTNFRWQRRQEFTHSVGTGPKKDHSLSNGNGKLVKTRVKLEQ